MRETGLIEVDLSPPEEQALRRLASEQGLTAEELAAEIIESRLAHLRVDNDAPSDKFKASIPSG